MKKYIIFFISWFVCIGFGFFMFFADRSSMGFVAIVNQWVKTDCIYSVLIGYAIAFSLVIALYLKDKLKHIKPRKVEEKTSETAKGTSEKQNAS